ncbi:MAG: hypothetical protein H0W21_10890 [Actinobacteria bacterium]|nr:hypothetical protein [Actinomycetota bacterium]
MDEAKNQTTPVDPLEATPPAFPPEEAAAFGKRLFGLDGVVSCLDSERDQNLRVVSGEGRSYLLKISNPADDIGVIEMQTKALQHIIRGVPDLPVMRPLPSDGPSASAHSIGSRRMSCRLSPDFERR